MAKVSVIIPSYGMPVYLEKGIQSVLSQSMRDWELFVVDDNNPDTEARRETEERMAHFASDSRVHYLKHPHNLNGAVARNTGIAAAQGEYIAFLDSDDAYMPDRFEKCCRAMEAAEDKVAGVYTGCEFRRNGKAYKTVKDVKPGNFLVDTLACTFRFCTGSNLFVQRSVVEELGGFDGAFLRHQDYEFLVRLFEKYDLAAIQEVLVIKNNENVNLPNVHKMIDIKKQYRTKYENLMNSLADNERKYILHAHDVQIAESAMRAKDYGTAKEYYAKASNSCRLTARELIRKYAFLAIK